LATEPKHNNNNMKTTKLIINETAIKETVLELRQAIQLGIEAWSKAGETVVRLLDEQGMTLEEIAVCANHELITAAVLGEFERVGRKQVLPKLLAARFPAAACVKRLPLSEQQRLMDEGVEVVVIHGKSVDYMKINVRDLTTKQAKQVFRDTEVRSNGAQRAWLEEQSSQKESKTIRTGQHLSWAIKHGKVIFREACELTRQELAVILTQLA
jgi:hypothetical protein